MNALPFSPSRKKQINEPTNMRGFSNVKYVVFAIETFLLKKKKIYFKPSLWVGQGYLIVCAKPSPSWLNWSLVCFLNSPTSHIIPECMVTCLRPQSVDFTILVRLSQSFTLFLTSPLSASNLTSLKLQADSVGFNDLWYDCSFIFHFFPSFWIFSCTTVPLSSTSFRLSVYSLVCQQTQFYLQTLG